MLWKIYVWIFFLINALSLIALDYNLYQFIAIITLLLGVGLNVAAFSYAYKKPVLSKQYLVWLFKLNVGMYAVFLLLEFSAFIQELIGSFGINLPTSGFVSIIASIPSLPALYATYKLAYQKPKSNPKKKKK